MADTGPAPQSTRSDGADKSSLLGARKPLSSDSRFDITAMVDLVFLMTIFFLVTSITRALAELDLPHARHAVAVETDSAVIMSICVPDAGQTAWLYLGDGRVDQPLTTPKAQEDAVRPYVEAGLKDGKTSVVIKAEKDVLYRDVARVATAVSAVSGANLHLAVWQTD